MRLDSRCSDLDGVGANSSVQGGGHGRALYSVVERAITNKNVIEFTIANLTSLFQVLVFAIRPASGASLRRLISPSSWHNG